MDCRTAAICHPTVCNLPRLLCAGVCWVPVADIAPTGYPAQMGGLARTPPEEVLFDRWIYFMDRLLDFLTKLVCRRVCSHSYVAMNTRLDVADVSNDLQSGIFCEQGSIELGPNFT